MNASSAESAGGRPPAPSPHRDAPTRTAGDLHSCLYECRVLHERFAPGGRRFNYRLFYLALDLDELPELDRRLHLLSINRANVFSVRERSLLPIAEPAHRPSAGAASARLTSTLPAPDGLTLKQRALAFCAAHGVPLTADARVTLITLPRFLGYEFNPVSFYFCQDRDGTPRAAIAEVTNTFREVKPFFVPLHAGAGATPAFRVRVPKHFYVSPFSSVEVEFDFHLRLPDGRLALQIDDYESGRRVLHSALVGQRVALGDGRLAWFLIKYPCLTPLVVARIHWQALRLWLRRVPFFRKAEHAEHQRDLYRPDASIAPRPLS